MDEGERLDVLKQAERLSGTTDDPLPRHLPPAAPPKRELVPPARAEAVPFLGTHQILDALDKDETGDAELLATLYADRIVYDHAERQWYLWNGQHWQPDDTGFMVRLVSDQVAAQYLQAAADRTGLGATSKEQKAEVDALIQRARHLRRKCRIKNVLELARSQPVGISGDQWDADPWLLGCANGTINLSTGTLQPGAPDDYIRTVSPTVWKGPDEPAPRWEEFLREVFVIDGEPELELIEFVQRLLGYGITGKCTEHVLPILWGEGRNGKDTLLETLRHVLGPWADAIARSLLLESGREVTRSATPDRIDLARKRLVWASESKEGERLNAGQVKLITGGGRIPARQMWDKNIKRLAPQHLPMLITNHRPHANADDVALWDRLLLIPFTQRFLDKPEKPNEHNRDPDLLGKLQAEASGVLAWLVRGCLEWQECGLQPPVVVRLATEEYRQEEDIVGRFLAEACTEGAELKAKASLLYTAYKDWCGECSVKPMSLTAFGKRMTKRFEKRTTRAGVFYYGVGLLSGEKE